MSDPRLKAVYDAASFLFIKKRYANTQVSQIAQEAGIATGTIYALFTGKKAILHFVLLGTLDGQFLNKDISIPFEEVDTSLLLEHLVRVAEDLFLQIGCSTNGVPTLSFADMLSNLFDYAAAYQVAFNIINENREALPEVESVYRQYINRLHKEVETNLLYYMKCGEVRQVELPQLHIRNIVEGITWWAMYLPYRAPHMKVPVFKAKEIALDILKHAYMTKPD